MCRWPRTKGRPPYLKHFDSRSARCENKGPSWAQGWPKNGPIMDPWGPKHGLNMGPSWAHGGPKLGPSCAHGAAQVKAHHGPMGGFAALLINIASDYRFAYVF